MRHQTADDYETTVIDTLNSIPDRQLIPGPTNLCPQCISDFGTDIQAEMKDEGGFSWHACECCHSDLAGDRYAAHSFVDGEVIHWDICVDCLHYLANGDLPVNLP